MRDSVVEDHYATKVVASAVIKFEMSGIEVSTMATEATRVAVLEASNTIKQTDLITTKGGSNTILSADQT